MSTVWLSCTWQEQHAANHNQVYPIWAPPLSLEPFWRCLFDLIVSAVQVLHRVIDSILIVHNLFADFAIFKTQYACKMCEYRSTSTSMLDVCVESCACLGVRLFPFMVIVCVLNDVMFQCKFVGNSCIPSMWPLCTQSTLGCIYIGPFNYYNYYSLHTPVTFIQYVRASSCLHSIKCSLSES